MNQAHDLSVIDVHCQGKALHFHAIIRTSTAAIGVLAMWPDDKTITISTAANMGQALSQFLVKIDKLVSEISHILNLCRL